MKKLIFIAVVLFTLLSCESKDVSISTKNDYTFTTTQTTTVSPSLDGYPQKTVSVTEIKSITSSEAKEAAAKLTYTSKSTTGGYTVTITSVCVYVLTKDYKPKTGTRV